jgi:hypothetical protein
MTYQTVQKNAIYRVAGEPAGVLAVWPMSATSSADQVDLVQRECLRGLSGPIARWPWVKQTPV